MLRALQLAGRGWGQTAPNPMVGAVLVRDGVVVGEGWHERYGGAHAEVNAIASAGERVRGSHLYVTLEPCTHHGRTPPCVDAVLQAGIARVTIGTLDDTAAGGGAGRLRDSGVEVDVGCDESAVRELNAPFHFRGDRPWVTLKLALSAEGAIAGPADAGGQRHQIWLTGDEARREVHRLRAGSDAIAVGAGTVLSDDPELTVRDYPAPRRVPLRVVFDRAGRIPPDSRLVKTARAIPTLVVVAQDNDRTRELRGRGVEVLVAGDPVAALRLLRARGVRSLLVEGGAALAGALLESDCVDRVVLLRSPTVLGPGALDAFAAVRSPAAVRARLELRQASVIGQDRMELYAVTGHDV